MPANRVKNSDPRIASVEPSVLPSSVTDPALWVQYKRDAYLNSAGNRIQADSSQLVPTSTPPYHSARTATLDEAKAYAVRLMTLNTLKGIHRVGVGLAGQGLQVSALDNRGGGLGVTLRNVAPNETAVHIVTDNKLTYWTLKHGFLMGFRGVPVDVRYEKAATLEHGATING